MSEPKGQHGFYPGTFDPVHSGHEEIADNASKYVDKVWVLPNPVRSKSKPNTTDVDTRRDLVKIAIAEHPKLAHPEGEAWEIYKKSYQDHGVDQAITALSSHLNVDPVHIVGQDVYEKRSHAGRKVMVVPRGSEAMIGGPDVQVLPTVGQVSSSEIREKLARGEDVNELSPRVLEEIKKRGLYEQAPAEAPETRHVREWISQQVAAWQAALAPFGIHVELGGSLISGLFVLEGADKYDADVKFIVDNPEDPAILQRIGAVTNLEYKKTISIKELPPEKSTSVMMERTFTLPGVRLPVDVEGCVRQGPYFNSHKLYKKLFTTEELEAIRQKKKALRNDKESYKTFKYETRAELVERAKAANLI